MSSPRFMMSSGGGAGSVSGSVLAQYIPASALIPRVTNGPGVNTSESTTNDVNYDTLDFDSATVEGASFDMTLPSAGTFTATFFWTADSGSGGVVWRASARATADNDDIDTAYGTPQTSTDTLLAAAKVHKSPASSAVTVAGSPASGERCQFLFERVPSDGSDTLAVDARLIGVLLNFEP